jgi:L-alanine-DL-glutamate epimerase-like enolase superfamily enzyme
MMTEPYLATLNPEHGDATIPKNGKIKVPTGPGQGLEPVSEALEKFRLSV